MCSIIIVLSILCLCLPNVAEAQANNNYTDYELVELFRVGDEARGDTVLFRNHEGIEIAVDNTGQFFVGGWQESPVLAFSKKGEFVGYVGTKGEGPGEFVSSSSVIIGPKGHIYVFDFGRERLSVFEPELFQFSHSKSIANPGNLFSPNKLLGISENGYFFRYITSHWMPHDQERGYKPGESRFEFVKLVDDNGLIVVESVAQLPATEFAVTTYSDEETSSMNVYPLPFGRRPFFAYKNGMIYTGWNDMINISVISEDGQILRTIKREHEVKRVTSKELRVKMSNMSMSRRERRDIRKSGLLPDTKPAYDAMIIDDNGHILIREYPDAEAEFAKWLIIDSDGELVGEMELNANLLLKTIKDGRAYASINSETHGPYVVVYSITK